LKEKKNANAVQIIKSQKEVKEANDNANTAAAAANEMETPEDRQIKTIQKFVEHYKDIYTKKIQQDKQNIKKLTEFTLKYDKICTKSNKCFKKFIEILKLKTVGDDMGFYVKNIGEIAPVDFFDNDNISKMYGKIFEGARSVTFEQKTYVYDLIIHDFVEMVKELLKEMNTKIRPSEINKKT
jgi:hypothetical protein